MSRRFRLDVAYEGTAFAGWQVQPGCRTVQGEIQAALRRLGEEDRPTGAGRTDAGVHALGMVAHVDLSRRWDSATLARALRAELPEDIALRRALGVDPGFHARFDARSRTYHYALSLEEDPFFRLRRWTIPVLPAAEWIRRETSILAGTRDLASLVRSGGGAATTTSHVESVSWTPAPGGAVFRITADRFLYGMVRALVGVLVRGFARGESPGYLGRILDAGRREAAGEAAPAAGLYLTAVAYPGEPEPPDPGKEIEMLAGLGRRGERA